MLTNSGHQGVVRAFSARFSLVSSDRKNGVKIMVKEFQFHLLVKRI